jgi:hypothetical protein
MLGKRILGIDPGETTGIALLLNGAILEQDQIKTDDLGNSVYKLNDLITTIKPDVIIYEDYRVYEWKSDDHKWSSVHTPKLIGVIICLCEINNLAYGTRMASSVKSFVTDDKLKDWGLYIKGKRHARDAIRHAVYQSVFE